MEWKIDFMTTLSFQCTQEKMCIVHLDPKMIDLN